MSKPRSHQPRDGSSACIVVGDRFLKFAETHSEVISFTTWSLSKFPKKGLAIVGLGLSQSERAAVTRLQAEGHVIGGELKPAPRSEVHKHEPKNIQITSPKRLSDGSFVCELITDGRCEIMSDHQAVEHVQGMLLSEATRQAILALVERFFIAPQDSTRYSFITLRHSVEFTRYAFAVPTTMSLRVMRQDLVPGRRLKFEVEMELCQAGFTVARAEIAFLAAEADHVEQREHEIACETVKATIEAAREIARKESCQ